MKPSNVIAGISVCQGYDAYRYSFLSTFLICEFQQHMSYVEQMQNKNVHYAKSLAHEIKYETNIQINKFSFNGLTSKVLKY